MVALPLNLPAIQEEAKNGYHHTKKECHNKKVHVFVHRSCSLEIMLQKKRFTDETLLHFVPTLLHFVPIILQHTLLRYFWGMWAQKKHGWTVLLTLGGLISRCL
jgi:hypothetical protein